MVQRADDAQTFKVVVVAGFFWLFILFGFTMNGRPNRSAASLPSNGAITQSGVGTPACTRMRLDMSLSIATPLGIGLLPVYGMPVSSSSDCSVPFSPDPEGPLGLHLTREGGHHRDRIAHELHFALVRGTPGEIPPPVEEGETPEPVVPDGWEVVVSSAYPSVAGIPRAEFLAAHIPGARYLDLDRIDWIVYDLPAQVRMAPAW